MWLGVGASTSPSAPQLTPSALLQHTENDTITNNFTFTSCFTRLIFTGKHKLVN
ncbi:unnamed protein product, partial [Nesidiocoris tenuis]